MKAEGSLASVLQQKIGGRQHSSAYHERLAGRLQGQRDDSGSRQEAGSREGGLRVAGVPAHGQVDRQKGRQQRADPRHRVAHAQTERARAGGEHLRQIGAEGRQNYRHSDRQEGCNATWIPGLCKRAFLWQPESTV